MITTKGQRRHTALGKSAAAMAAEIELREAFVSVLVVLQEEVDQVVASCFCCCSTSTTDAADTAAVEALFVIWNERVKSGILYDWPELVE